MSIIRDRASDAVSPVPASIPNAVLLDLADRLELAAKAALDEAISTLERMNENAREYPVHACGRDYWGSIGGMFALADRLRAASAMSAGTAETQSGSGLQPASAVGNAETPQPSSRSST